MYADLFDQLGRSRNAAANATVETPPIVAFKAGLITLTAKQQQEDEPDTRTAPSAATTTGAGTVTSYTCTADTATRGQVRLIRNPNNTDEIKWQLYDRRRDTVVETDIIPPGTTFTKVEPQHRGLIMGTSNASTANSKDRIFVWTRPASTPIYKMYWLQDADDTDDDDIVKTVNETLRLAKAVTTTTTTSTTTTSGARSGIRSTTGGLGGTNADPQVDTLSSILENLGMPAVPPAATSASGRGTAGTATSSSTPTMNQLTLADLQGAMASIQQQQVEQQAQQVDLTDIITTEAIMELIETNEEAVQRLLPFLPEQQQSVEHLRDNLLSPSVRRSLGLLSQALTDGDGESYGSVIANFQLDANAGQDALVRGHPIAAFLDCITASVTATAAATAATGTADAAEQQPQEEEKDALSNETKEDEEMKEEETKDDTHTAE